MPGINKTMKEFASGKLHSGSKKGPVVKNKSQAIAIGLNSKRKAKRSVGMPMGPAGSGIALGKGQFSQLLGYMENNGAQGNSGSTQAMSMRKKAKRMIPMAAKGMKKAITDTQAAKQLPKLQAMGFGSKGNISQNQIAQGNSESTIAMAMRKSKKMRNAMGKIKSSFKK